MNLNFRDAVASANFRPSQVALDFEKTLDGKLGGRPRYESVRLMLGRSLLEASSPKPLNDNERSTKGDLRGRELFGSQLDLWLSLFVLEGNMGSSTQLDDFRAAVEAHWARGSALLKDDLENADNDIVKLAISLTHRLPEEGKKVEKISGPGTSGPIKLQLGSVSKTHPAGKPVQFILNGVGSPHIVMMGKTGQGKTRIGVNLAQQIVAASKVPFIYIDPKPDFSPGGQYHNAFSKYGHVTNLLVGNQPIPLDFIPSPDKGNVALQSACMRLRDSICRSAPSVGPKQRDRLLTCIELVASNPGERSLSQISQEYTSALATDGERPDSVASLLNELTRFKAYSPTLSPEAFFSQSWILSFQADIPDSFKNLIMQLLLDAEAAYWLGQDDSPLIEGYRSMRHLLVIDEARRVLKKGKSESLIDLITRSRSRGCCIMLLSQDPSDFEGTEYDFMTQIGAVISFACNQTDRGLSSLKGVFGRKVMPNEFSDTRLTEGLAFCKLPQREPEIIQCW